MEYGILKLQDRQNWPTGWDGWKKATQAAAVGTTSMNICVTFGETGKMEYMEGGERASEA